MRLVILLCWVAVLVAALDYLYPIKLFTVLLHEYSHAIVAVLTGGTVVELMVSSDLTGHVKSSGGSRFLTLSAGYIGSLVFGALIFYWAYVRNTPTVVFYILGSVIVAGMIGFSPTLSTAGITAMILVVLYVLLQYLPQYGKIVLGSIGLSSMLYAIRDIYTHTIIHPQLKSDAHMLASEIGGTTQMWGVIWLVVSLIAFVIVIKRSVQYQNRIALNKNMEFGAQKAKRESMLSIRNRP